MQHESTPQPMTVVIQSTVGRETLLQRTLASLANCHVPENFTRVLVVEDSGTNALGPYVAQLPPQFRAEHVHSTKSGTAASKNRALARINQGLIVFFDDDIRFNPRILESYAGQQQARPGKWYFGGPTEADYDHEPQQWLKRYLPCSARGFSIQGDRQVDAPRFLGFNWAAYAEDLHAIGGFDETRGPCSTREDKGDGADPTGDETDAQRRLLGSGAHGWYVPEAKVWHYVPRHRCSASWAINRIYRVGIEHGLNVSPTTWADRKCYRNVLLRQFRAPARSLMARLYPDRERIFRNRYWKSHDRGFWRGQCRRHARVKQAQPTDYHQPSQAAPRASVT